MEQDIRWKQRFSNFEKAFAQLSDAIKLHGNNPISIIKEGVIQRFEFTHELAWKIMKDYLEYEGIQNITGSRSAVKEAYNKGLIAQGQVWMDMIESRNKTFHTYDEAILDSEFMKILTDYHPAFQLFYTKMKSLL